MDQYLSTVIIAMITGVFSVITIIIQKKQDKVINKIDEQTLFIEREKNLRQQLAQKEKEREAIIHAIMILILDTNLYILNNSDMSGGAELNGDVFSISEKLKTQYNSINDDIDDISKEYEVVINMTEEFQKELEKIKNSGNKEHT